MRALNGGPAICYNGEPKYDSTEECSLIEWEVVVETRGGKRVEFEKGDPVTFPKGLASVRDIKAPVRKHDNFT